MVTAKSSIINLPCFISSTATYSYHFNLIMQIAINIIVMQSKAITIIEAYSIGTFTRFPNFTLSVWQTAIAYAFAGP